MTLEEIRDYIGQSVEELMKRDKWLLQMDLSERSITHRLAIYLEPLFSGYDVDCEYNGDIGREDSRKKVMLLCDELKHRGLLRDAELEDEYGYVQRQVYPDIIVHQRGTNTENLMVIEVKKSSSRVCEEYDRLKVTAYTAARTPEDLLRYEWGVVLKIKTGRDFPGWTWDWYQDGQPI